LSLSIEPATAAFPDRPPLSIVPVINGTSLIDLIAEPETQTS
jgi:hypothetical protein